MSEDAAFHGGSAPAKKTRRQGDWRVFGQEAELRMRLALDAALIGVWEYDVATGALTWDERVREVAEVGPRIVPTWERDFLPSVHPDDRSAVTAAFGALFAEGLGAHLQLTCRIVGRRTGAVTYSALEGRCLESRGGGLRVIGTAKNVTESVLLTQRLERMNEELEARVRVAVAERQIWADMFESSDDPIAALDVDLKVIAMNGAYRAALERHFGVTLEIGDHLPTRLDHIPHAREVSIGLWRRAIAGEVIDVPRTPLQDDGGGAFDIKFRPLRDKTGRLVGAFQYSRDVSERARASERLRETQAALHRAQKMESIGQLTGGIAHDFNNLLQVVGGNLQLLRGDLPPGSRALRRVTNALAGVSKGAALAAQLLAFGRRQPLEPKVVALGKCIEGMDDLLRRALGETVELRTTVESGLWNTLVDPGQIENAVLNLALNARDAMPLGGRLTIEAVNATLDAEYARRHADVVPGDYVMVGVTDTGAGMTPEVLERVFEPFFTTKAEGKGTGLGLSMVYGLVKQSDGHVKIYSEAGEGTTVKLYLPRCTAPETAPAPTETLDVEGGRETILVVEDDPAVRDIALELLSDLGYHVLVARDAASGLKVIESGAHIDVLFTDVVMPGTLRSPELAALARERLPRLAVLFTSGYTENAIVHGGRLDAGVELLSKPYTREALARKIRKVILEVEAKHGPKSLGCAGAKGDSDAFTLLIVDDDALVRARVANLAQTLGGSVLEAPSAAAALGILASERVDVLITDRNLSGVSGERLARAAIALLPHLRVIVALSAAGPDLALGDAVYLVKPYSLEGLKNALDAVASKPSASP